MTFYFWGSLALFIILEQEVASQVESVWSHNLKLEQSENRISSQMQNPLF